MCNKVWQCSCEFLFLWIYCLPWRKRLLTAVQILSRTAQCHDNMVSPQITATSIFFHVQSDKFRSWETDIAVGENVSLCVICGPEWELFSLFVYIGHRPTAAGLRSNGESRWTVHASGAGEHTNNTAKIQGRIYSVQGAAIFERYPHAGLIIFPQHRKVCRTECLFPSCFHSWSSALTCGLVPLNQILLIVTFSMSTHCKLASLSFVWYKPSEELLFGQMNSNGCAPVCVVVRLSRMKILKGVRGILVTLSSRWEIVEPPEVPSLQTKLSFFLSSSAHHSW